jgi:hypothetical protein
MSGGNDFFIGWEEKVSLPLAGFVRKIAIGVLFVGIVIAVMAAAFQQTIGSGSWNLEVKEFSGILFNSPVPLLIVSDESGDDFEVYYLVSEFKHGIPTEMSEENHLHKVTLQGSLINNDHGQMIEVIVGSIANVDGVRAKPLKAKAITDDFTACGEIVDSKCYLGVMNPGIRKTHRVCAINCIMGGIPPVFVIENEAGEDACLLLLGENGERIDREILEYVAEPVEVSGSLKEIGPIRALYLDMSSLKRLSRGSSTEPSLCGTPGI